jgi:hypothetical protein
MRGGVCAVGAARAVIAGRSAAEMTMGSPGSVRAADPDSLPSEALLAALSEAAALEEAAVLSEAELLHAESTRAMDARAATAAGRP